MVFLHFKKIDLEEEIKQHNSGKEQSSKNFGDLPMVRLVLTGGSLIRRPKRSLQTVLTNWSSLRRGTLTNK